MDHDQKHAKRGKLLLIVYTINKNLPQINNNQINVNQILIDSL